MPPVRTQGRASRACTGCRKGKTRCYASSSGSCLRCNTLRLRCSLQDDPLDVPLSDAAIPAATVSSDVSRHDCVAVEERVATLERSVRRLTDAIGLDLESQFATPGGSIPPSRFAGTGLEESAPLLVIRDAASNGAAPTQDHEDSATVIGKGIVTSDEAKYLLNLFRANYRRWIALREQEHKGPDLDLEYSPLLLCACCLIAVRHWSVERAKKTAPLLFGEAKRLLSEQLLQASQPLSFFQAILVLSLWSTTVGQKPLSIDSWLISGYAIQHASASDAFTESRFSSSLDSEFDSTIGKLLLWNRICLAHLHACVSMRRTSMVNKEEIERIRRRLPPGELSNYEMRMVAELNLYWTLYENVVVSQTNLPRALAALQGWKHVWYFLFDQPRSQFLQMGFHFAELLIHEQCLNNKSAAVRESLVLEMVRVSSAILTIAMDTSFLDERTRHLTDHIYHMIAFAAVTLCRLLCKYEAQMRSNLHVTELDMLVVQTIDWLRALASPVHIGHTMSNVIHAVQRKLRPGFHMVLQQQPDPQHLTFEHMTFPDLLGMNGNMSMEANDFDWNAMIPDWQSLSSDEMAQPQMQHI